MPAKSWKAFVLALALLAGTGGAAVAGKAEDAKKYTDQLKSAKDAKAKVQAIGELGKLGQVQYAYAEEAIPNLLKALDDKDAGVRAAAAKAVGMIGPEGDEVVTKLTDMVKDDKDEGVRMAAVGGLAYLGDRAKGSAADLRKVKKDLDDPKGKFAKAIDNTLKAIAPKKPK